MHCNVILCDNLNIFSPPSWQPSWPKFPDLESENVRVHRKICAPQTQSRESTEILKIEFLTWFVNFFQVDLYLTHSDQELSKRVVHSLGDHPQVRGPLEAVPHLPHHVDEDSGEEDPASKAEDDSWDGKLCYSEWLIVVSPPIRTWFSLLTVEY